VTGKSAKADLQRIREEADAKIAEAEKRASENLDIAKRIQADFDNFRKRTQRENEDFKRYATESFIADVLVIVDDLERALMHADAESDLAIGVNGTRSNLMRLLISKGLSEIPTDIAFDPNMHEAFGIQDGDDEGKIAEVFQKGYRIGDRILRYAKVKVIKRTAEDQTEEGEQKCQG